MKETNLISIIAAYKQLEEAQLKSYLEYFSISIKNNELKDLDNLVNDISKINDSISLFAHFYLGYNIPQIGKEFDLLRIGTEYVVNIELKSNSTEEIIKKQLKRNEYYLSFLAKRILLFTYVSESKKLFTINVHNNLVEIPITHLIEILAQQTTEKIIDINNLFNPSNYLVSPFNSGSQFIRNEYFLTSQQEEFKNTILKKIEAKSDIFFAIKGKAGTGKTLLTYDIAKEYISAGKNVALIHCGQLNSGHINLTKNYGWQIYPAKDTLKINLNIFEIVIVDEAQRFYPYQLEHIIAETVRLNSNCIFSYDAQQCLRKQEIDNNTESIIDKVLTIPAFELTGKIRTNAEISSFIYCLFDKQKQKDKTKITSVELNYFSNYKEVKNFIIEKQKDNWKSINFTPDRNRKSPYDLFRIEENSDNAHTVIGQEYDKVIAVIDQHFYYKNNKILSTNNYPQKPYYHPTNMLFQIMSRTRIQLCVVIINNKEILERCLNILK